MRQAWLCHQVSDWAVDDAFIESLHDSVRELNYHADTQLLSGG